MRAPRSGSLLVGSVAAALVLLTASPLLAQQGAVITGRVTTEQGDPLGGASIVVGNTNPGAVTAANGTYTITIGADAAKGQEVVLTARYIGRKPVSRTITLTLGSQEQNFQLATDPLRLEEVVVTGVGEATARKNLPFTVGGADKEQLQAVPGATALEALQGKVAAVRLVPTSAQPGGEMAIRLRGATSIGGRQDPLFIVDGVLTQYGLADMAPEDVARVEVIKGAAASSLMSQSLSNSAWVGTVPCDTRCRRAATESRTIFSTTSSGKRLRSENLMKLLAAFTPARASLCFSTTSFSAT